MRFTYPDGVIEIDFLERVVQNSTNEQLASNFDQSSTISDALTDPLRFGLQCFIDSVRLGLPARVSGRDGRRALETALMITERLTA